jgi:hypothetical protein
MLKHVGRHGDRKVAIIFREIPNEDHMCLVIYPDVLPTHIHNSVMSVLESAPGQQATNLADVFHRNLLPDGRNILQTLHAEGMLKKVATNQIILTPTPTASVKLDEINRLVKEMESGTEAHKRMQEIDKNSGLVDPTVKREAERMFKRKQLEADAARRNAGQPSISVTDNSALDDRSLAANLLEQAKQMENDAQGMINEAARMKKEAERLHPSVTTRRAKTVAVITEKTEATTKRKSKVKQGAAVQ